ncbi:MAG: flagellar assembly protein FliH [Treponema sp.]|nr:MAG: flagellar assembly protein FliH [Treponema sp.]
MAKQVFRPNEIKLKDNEKKFTLPLLHDYRPHEEKPEVVEEIYQGPSAEDLRKEAEAFRQGWEIEKQHLLEEANAQADEIIKNAKDAAFEEVKRKTDEASVIKSDAQAQADEIIANAKSEAEKIIQDAHLEEQKIKDDAKQDGFKQGHDDGYSAGESEIERLVERLRKMVEALMLRREEILKETEQQIVELVILMTRKVVKIISETQKTAIMSNILAALKKVKSRGNVILHVNLEDLKLASANADEFIKRVENIQGITVVEDSTVEKGGCVVETDFGAIDARISSQLSELEEKIMEISPIKSVKKGADIPSAE